jgi:hypothetical protein
VIERKQGINVFDKTWRVHGLSYVATSVVDYSLYRLLQMATLSVFQKNQVITSAAC